jgi:hypothetical protein
MRVGKELTMNELTTGEVFEVDEDTVEAIIVAASDYHWANHGNCDYEVCDDPICAAAWRLEQETGIYEVYNQ